MAGGIEFDILYFLQSLHTPWLDLFMKNVTSLGDHGIFWILTGLVFCASGQQGLWAYASCCHWRQAFSSETYSLKIWLPGKGRAGSTAVFRFL